MCPCESTKSLCVVDEADEMHDTSPTHFFFPAQFCYLQYHIIMLKITELRKSVTANPMPAGYVTPAEREGNRPRGSPTARP